MTIKAMTFLPKIIDHGEDPEDRQEEAEEDPP
jgi:hypothetical protein